MATNFVQPGNTLTIPAPATVISGEVVVQGSIVGVAAGDAASGDPVDVHVVGVFKLPKVAADAVEVGTPIYWDTTAGLATVTSSGNTKLGVAVEAAGSGTASVKVRLSAAF